MTDLRYPPGPRNTIPGRNLRAMQRDPLTFLLNVAREYGDAAHFRMGPRHVYLFNHPDLIRDLLVTRSRSFIKSVILQRTKVILGEGLLTSEGDFHLRQRRLAQPAFHRQRIARYAEEMIVRSSAAGERWQDGESLDIAHEMMALTLSIVAKTLFDAEVEDDADEIGGALTDLMELFPLLLSPWADVIQKVPFLPPVRRMREAIARLDRVIYGIIAERRRSGEDRGDLLSMLLLAQDDEGDGTGMSDRQVRDEAMTLFLAGHETTANALAWTWYLLARHPEVEREMHREIDEVLGDRVPTPDDYPRLRYTEMVLSESMRLFPPAWAVGRMATERVQVGPWTLEKGSIALASQWVTHRDPRWWADPERFDPTRFAADRAQERPRLTYFPFGAGPRICIGEPFAWMEGVLVLATIARRWRFEMTAPVETQPLITLRPKGGIPARARLRVRQ
jgi:cytochrome P450